MAFYSNFNSLTQYSTNILTYKAATNDAYRQIYNIMVVQLQVLLGRDPMSVLQLYSEAV